MPGKHTTGGEWKGCDQIWVELSDGHADLWMGEWACAASDDEALVTGGASTCGIVAVVNRTQDPARLVRQAVPFENTDDTAEMLGDADFQSEAGDDIEIWLAG